MADGRTFAALLRSRAAMAPLWIPVAGLSMGSAYPAGAKLLVGPRGPADRPRIGEVWVFTLADGTLVAHRAVGTRHGAHVFAGDANQRNDRPVARDELVGPAIALDTGRQVRQIGRRGALRPVLTATLRRARRLVNSPMALGSGKEYTPRRGT